MKKRVLNSSKNRTWVLLLLELFIILSSGCEQKLKPGNPFEQYDSEDDTFAQVTIPKYPEIEQDIYIEGDYPPVAQVTYEEDGRSYHVDAVQGQVIVVFTESVSQIEALQVIHDAGGQIAAQTSKNNFYLVSTCVGKELVFMQYLQDNAATEFVFPNAISYPCIAVSYVMDNFNYVHKISNATHGEMVADAMGQCDSGGLINKRDIGEIGETYMVWSKIEHNLKEILEGATEEIQPIINMSFSTHLDKNGNKWANVTDNSIRDEFRLNYINEIKYLLSIIKPYNNKEFIIVKAAGNHGIRDFEKEILSPLYDKLSKKQRLMLDRHFLFVAAKDDNKTYSNDLKNCSNHKWVTKVDISDYKFSGIHVPGTSIASPRTACYLNSASRKHNLKVTEVLQYARMATEESPNHILTPELLDKIIEMEKRKTPEVTIEGVLRICLLNGSGGGGITYLTDVNGDAVNAFEDDDLDNPYCKMISEYRETDFDNTHLAFVLEVDNAINVVPYLEAGDDEFLDNSFQSVFMIVPQFQYSGKDFAKKYANKRIKAMGSLYVPGGGWRNTTAVVMSVKNIELLDD